MQLFSLEAWLAPGSILAVAGIVAGYYFFFIPFQHGKIEKLFNSEPDREALKASLKPASPHERYRRHLSWLLEKLHRFFGPTHKWPAFDRCLTIAFAYPIGLFTLAWLFGAPGKFYGVTLLPGFDSWLRRFLLVLASTGYASGLFVYFFNIDRVGEFVARGIKRLRGSTTSLSKKDRGVARTVAVAFAAASSFAVASAVAVAGASALALGISLAAVVAFALASATNSAFAVTLIVAVAIAVASTVAIAVASASASASASAGVIIGVYGVFLALLPIVNAFVDWLSWMATRWCLTNAAKTRSGIRGTIVLLRDLIVDFMAAFLCLVALAVLLPNVIEAANLALKSTDLYPINWKGQLGLAITEPLGQGLLVTGMLFTTLLPTVIHLGYALRGVVSALLGSEAELYRLLPDTGGIWGEETDLGPEAAKQRAIKLYLRMQYLKIPSLLVAGAAMVGLAWLVFGWLAHIGMSLGVIAVCATSWSHGNCNLDLM